MGVLIVDPIEEDINNIQKLLRNWGYHKIFPFMSIHEANSSLTLQDTSNLRSIFGIDVALVDISIGVEAYKFIDSLKKSYIFQDVPVIAMSEHARAEGLSSAFAYGATDFLSKPIEDYELKARLRAGIRLKYEIERRKARERELIEVTNQLSDLNELLSTLSLVDSLTSIPNRRAFDNTLDQEWRRAIRHGGPITVIMIDIDFFKQYNDTYGHQMGDRCLSNVARELKSKLRRPGDLVARYGGEEFALVLPNTNAHQTETLCKKVLEGVEGLMIPHEASSISKFVTISMGVASFEPSIEKQPKFTAEDLLQLADAALYEAKQKGRNRCVFSSESQVSSA